MQVEDLELQVKDRSDGSYFARNIVKLEYSITILELLQL